MKLSVYDDGVIDLTIGPNGLVNETGLESAVIVSLLTDRRAGPDDILPNEKPGQPINQDRRGWCGDALADDQGDRIGSRLWLLSREKQTEETRQRAIFYAKEALKWLIDDKIATAINVDAEWVSTGHLNMLIEIVLIDGAKFNMQLNTGVIYAI